MSKHATDTKRETSFDGDGGAGAVTTRAARVNPVFVTAAVLLSVCAAVITFWIMTEIETRWKARQDGVVPLAYNTVDTEADDGVIGSSLEVSIDMPPGVHDAASGAVTGSAAGDNAQAAAPETPPVIVRRNTPPSASSYAPPKGPDVPFMIDNAPPHTNLFALTFDGGSHANAAGDILDTLASRGVSSTMFLTGEFIRKYPDVVSRIAAQGHELGNHTHRHPRLTSYAEDQTQSTLPNVTREFIHKELNGAAQLLADKTGLSFAPLWRAPYGEYNRQICRWALEAGYVHVAWRQGRGWWYNLDTNDWVPNEDSPAYRTPEQVMTKIVNIAAQPGGLNGGIILMHLGTERKVRDQQVHTILGGLIDTLRGMGYEPVKVSEMLYRTGIDINALAFGE